MQVSTDGLIRLTLDELMSLPIRHLFSGVDGDPSLGPSSCGRPTTISGFTEWASHTQPLVTLGWDWCLSPTSGSLLWSRLGEPRTNVLLTHEDGAEKSWAQSLEELGTVVDALPWSDEVPKLLGTSPDAGTTYQLW
jgi:Domain of unknown function (DUF4902)